MPNISNKPFYLYGLGIKITCISINIAFIYKKLLKVGLGIYINGLIRTLVDLIYTL